MVESLSNQVENRLTFDSLVDEVYYKTPRNFIDNFKFRRKKEILKVLKNSLDIKLKKQAT